VRCRIHDVKRQYAVTDPLKVRIQTHRLYGERPVDLDAEAEQLLGLSGGESVLDEGCGPGKFLLHLRRGGHHGRLVAFDQSQAMIDEAHSSARDEGFEVECIVGDAMDLPFEDGSFDWVIGRHMLYHVPDIPLALRKFARVSEKGALVSTNGRRNLPRIADLIDNLLTAFGYAPVQMPSERFCIENADEQFAAAGLVAGVTTIENALVFTEVEPIVRYVKSSLPSFELPAKKADDMERWFRVKLNAGVTNSAEHGETRRGSDSMS
jgi:ubiquinone/menaquinone biosynthesis C-methylase UbiE